ncbi:hypothetical protein BDW67DRAFT_177724 [Aspergillus spinulosporus]
MSPSLKITHIGTATAILEINGINMLTDPLFSSAGHEDHVDNLDDLGRQLLDGRLVFTTTDGAKNLSPRPGVHGLKPWEKLHISIAGKEFTVIGTPSKHAIGGECSGFIITADEFGCGRDGLPNAISSPGTRYLTSPRYHITMDGKQAAKLFRDIKADYLAPMHYESWHHFTQFGENLHQVFREEGIHEQVCWLEPGRPVTVL